MALTLAEAYKAAGVHDLPTEARKQFAIALTREEDGKHEEAAIALDKAIMAEAIHYAVATEKAA